MPATLIRLLHSGDYGADVQAVRRACLKFCGEKPSPLTPKQQRTYGKGMVQLVKRAQDQAVLAQTGTVGPNLMEALRRADMFDDYGVWLLESYAKAHRVPALIEPMQGFESLHHSLWKLFTTGRKMGLSDLGTYNPSPSNVAINSDHAVYPAYAFDLGISPDTGFANDTGRRFFSICASDLAVEYVILGNKIASVGRGLHTYTRGGHDNHVHVSGRR